MLSTSLVALGLAIIGAYATPAARAVGSLEVSLSTPTEKVASPSEIRVIATVRNVGDQDLKVVKFGTVLDDDLRTPSFIIKKDGKEVHFTRVAMVSELMNRLSENHPSEDDWVVIKAGETARAEHNVSTAYDFSTSGPGAFTLDSISRFRVAGLDGTFETTIADTHAATVIVTAEISERKLDLRKRFTVDCWNDDWTPFLKEGLKDSKYLAYLAASYVWEHGPNDPLYKDYFGTNDPQTVAKNWGYIIVGGTDKPTLHCHPKQEPCFNSIFFTKSKDELFFCEYFFHTYTSDRLCHDVDLNTENFRGGEVISALAFATVPGMGSKALTCSDSQGMADDEMLNNIYTYRCFALQVYINTKCH